MNNQAVLNDSIFRIGEVIAVDGRKVKVQVDKLKNVSHLLYKGELIKNVSVGSYIKIAKGFVRIIGKVEGEYTKEDKNFTNKKYENESEPIMRILDISLLGFIDNNVFERGIKELPLIGNECHLLYSNEYSSIHKFVKDDDIPLVLGHLSLEKGQEISFGVNALFASHIGIFGNTGSGKSYTLAKIYETLLKQFHEQNKFKENARFFLFDFNGEYIGENVIISGTLKKRYNLSTRSTQVTDKFPITEEEIENHTFWSIFLTATEKTQTPFIERALNNIPYKDAFNSLENFKAELKDIIRDLIGSNSEKYNIINFLRDIYKTLSTRINNMTDILNDFQSDLKYNQQTESYYFCSGGVNIYANQADFSALTYNRFDNIQITLSEITYLEKIKLRFLFHYYYEILKGYSSSEHIAPLLKRLDKRFDDLNKVINIVPSCSHDVFNVVSLKNVNLQIKKILPLLICKQIYEEQKRSSDKSKSLNIIIDEAHNILSHNSERESETWKDYRLETFEEIIKEGRKFGVFLTIASQRPSDMTSPL